MQFILYFDILGKQPENDVAIQSVLAILKVRKQFN